MVRKIKDVEMYSNYPKGPSLVVRKQMMFAAKWRTLEAKAKGAKTPKEVDRLFKEAMRLAKSEEKSNRTDAINHLRAFRDDHLIKTTKRGARGTVWRLTRNFIHIERQDAKNTENYEKEFPKPIAKALQSFDLKRTKMIKTLFQKLFGDAKDKVNLQLRSMEKKV